VRIRRADLLKWLEEQAQPTSHGAWR
jgi:hypothetical protein